MNAPASWATMLCIASASVCTAQMAFARGDPQNELGQQPGTAPKPTLPGGTKTPTDAPVVREVATSDIDEGTAWGELGRLSLQELFDIEVTSASLHNETIAQAPGVLSVLTWRDFRTFQYDSIADALRVHADLDVLDDYSTYNVGVRGVHAGWRGRSRGFKVMLDQQDLSFRPNGGSFLGPEAMPRLAIENVEVIRGPLSVLYGANAYLGVINITPNSSRKMKRVSGGNARLQGAYLNHWGNGGGLAEAALWWNDTRWDLFAAFSTRRVGRGGLTLPKSSPRHNDIAASGVSLRTDNDHERTSSGYLTASLTLPQAGTLRIDGLLQYSDRTANFDPESEPLLEARLSYYNIVSRLDYDSGALLPWQIRMSAGLATGGPTDRQRLYDPFRPFADHLQRPYSYLSFNGVATAAMLSPQWGSLTLGADIVVDHEELPGLRIVDDRTVVQELDLGREFRFVNLGAFAQGRLELTERLTGLAGARFERHNLYGSQFNYRGVLIYALGKRASLKALVASAFQAPSPISLFGGEHPRLLGIESNDSLEPQHVLTTELAFTTRLGDIARLQLSAYRNRLTNFAEFETIAAQPRARNRASIRAMGGSAELEVSGRGVPIVGFANISYVHTQVSRSEVATLKVSEQTRLFPDLKANVGLSYEFKAAHLRPFAVFRWTGRRWADRSNLVFRAAGEQEEYALPSHGLFDAGIASTGLYPLQSRQLTFSVRVTNLLDTRYRQPGFAGIDVPGRRREVFASLEQEL